MINRENTKATSEYDFTDSKKKLFLKGNCDDVIRMLVKDLGWEEDLDKLISAAAEKK